MRRKKLKNGITFYTDDHLYTALKQASNQMEVSLGKLMREAVRLYLKQNIGNGKE